MSYSTVPSSRSSVPEASLVSNPSRCALTLDSHSQSHPPFFTHFPVAFPLAWQSNRHMVSEAQRPYCIGVTQFSSQSQSVLSSLHVPLYLPIDLHALSQKSALNLHFVH